MIRRLLILTAIAVALAACGKKAPPEPPSKEKATYPRTYPTS